MPRFKNRSGDRHGRLLVATHAGRDHRGKHLWNCLCDCGNEKVIVSDNLSSGKSNSCGCLRAEFLATKGNQYGLYEDRELALLKVQYSHLKRRSKKLGFDSIITVDEFSIMVKSPCKYCGAEHSREIEDRLNESKSKKRLSSHVLKCNGIDRRDSSIGYVAENTVACCKTCNFAKHVMSETDFYEWIKRVYAHSF